jgi:hypothetical protein
VSKYAPLHTAVRHSICVRFEVFAPVFLKFQFFWDLNDWEIITDDSKGHDTFLFRVKQSTLLGLHAPGNKGFCYEKPINAIYHSFGANDNVL